MRSLLVFPLFVWETIYADVILLAGLSRIVKLSAPYIIVGTSTDLNICRFPFLPTSLFSNKCVDYCIIYRVWFHYTIWYFLICSSIPIKNCTQLFIYLDSIQLFTIISGTVLLSFQHRQLYSSHIQFQVSLPNSSVYSTTTFEPYIAISTAL